MKKRCSKCGGEKELEEFVKNKKCKNGRTNECNKCALLYARERYKNNPDKRKEHSKRWKANNSDRVKEADKKRYKNNPDKRKERVKKWQQNNLKKYNLAQSKSSKKDREALGDSYIKTRFCDYLKINRNQITPQMIQLKREQLMFFRELKSLKRRIANGTTI